jgi:hypothetical protein
MKRPVLIYGADVQNDAVLLSELALLLGATRTLDGDALSARTPPAALSGALLVSGDMPELPADVLHFDTATVLLERLQQAERQLAGALALIADIHEEVRDHPSRPVISSDSYLPPELVERLAATVPVLVEYLDPEEIVMEGSNG